ncbi:hypothetical protein U737_16360 [Methylomonas sp. LW13]|uniref:hypothetical protein n=1 Tax=unclassified Methylomonas TaxID=2608980 RepID=UPI00051B6FB0|nr:MULTISPECIES: hypothetical protein [unclassified Methylomonas]PKD37908.1 hypothetical protein CWO84_21890 [Methylomonas sp. Kb3]QBC28340.1 hypothetical protein U737_16360 [Methylomonas sp. LW13]
MRELTITEMSVVGGGFIPPSEIHPFMDARIALTTFKGLGYLGVAFKIGYTLGEILNENTDIQKFIAQNLDKVVNALHTSNITNAQLGEDGDGE